MTTPKPEHLIGWPEALDHGFTIAQMQQIFPDHFGRGGLYYDFDLGYKNSLAREWVTEHLNIWGFPTLDAARFLVAECKKPLVEVCAGSGYFSYVVGLVGGECVATTLYQDKKSRWPTISSCAIRAIDEHPDRDVLVSWVPLGSDLDQRICDRVFQTPGRRVFMVWEACTGSVDGGGFFERFKTGKGFPWWSWGGLHDSFDEILPIQKEE